MSKSRGVCFTLNNYTEEDEARIEAVIRDKCTYGIVGREVGEENGVPHLQGYCYAAGPRTFNAWRTLLGESCHIEFAKGNADENRAYCSKQGHFTEFGNPPVSQKRKGEIEQERWERARKLAREGDVESIDPDIYVRYYRTLKEIAKDHMERVPDADDVTGEWYYGLAGYGKSMTARQNFPGAYFKACNKWWDGYQEEEFVIIDDFDKTHACLGHHLKIWGDRYAFIAETKGGARMLRPKKIVITSQYHPDLIWEDEETRAAIKRRFKITEFVFRMPPPEPEVVPPADDAAEQPFGWDEYEGPPMAWDDIAEVLADIPDSFSQIDE